MPAAPSEIDRDRIASAFADILPMLRARLGITQKELGDRVGATRQTIMFAENKRRPLTWTMFLSLFFLFYVDQRTQPFLLASGIITEDLSHMLFGSASMLPTVPPTQGPEGSMLHEAQKMMVNLRKIIGDE